MGVFALLVSAALAQEVCDRPIPPEDLAPPSARSDPEFRAFLNSEYQNYLGADEGRRGYPLMLPVFREGGFVPATLDLFVRGGAYPGFGEEGS